MYADAVGCCERWSSAQASTTPHTCGETLSDLSSRHHGVEMGNKYIIVFQNLFTKWPMVFPAPDQKSERIARLLCEEIVPMFGVPESLLSDRGTNLVSNLMLDVCRILGTSKLNTTAYHPECDGTVKHFNRTLKTTGC